MAAPFDRTFFRLKTSLLPPILAGAIFTGASKAQAGDRLVFDSFLGARLYYNGLDPTRSYAVPAGIAIDSRGVIYVADPLNNQVKLFDGGPAKTLGISFTFPVSVAVDSRNDDVWIANTGAVQVVKVDKNGNVLMTLGSPGTGPGQFTSPAYVAVDPKGNLYVGDDAGVVRGVNTISDPSIMRIQKFSSDGTFIRAWGSFCRLDSNGNPAAGPCNGTAPGALAVGDGQFAPISGVAVDSAGNVYVGEEANERVQKFNTDGFFIKKWGSLGSGDGQFNSPGGIAVDWADDVYVADYRNDRIQKFDGNGTFLGKQGGTGWGLGSFKGPFTLATMPHDLVLVCRLLGFECQKLYVSEKTNHRVQVLESRPDADDDSIVDEVDTSPTVFSNDAQVGDTLATVVDRSGPRFTVYAPTPGSTLVGAASGGGDIQVAPNTIRVTAEGPVFPLLPPGVKGLRVSAGCTAGRWPSGGLWLTMASDTSFQWHCSTPTLDVVTGPIDWTFTAADGTTATATMTDGQGMSVDPLTSSIQSNAGNLQVVVGARTVTLAAGQSVFVDTTPPATASALLPAPNAAGWIDTAATVTLTAVDNAGGSGVKEIRYSLTGAQTVDGGTEGGVATVPVSAEGTTTLKFFARDNAGNDEAPKTLTLNVDKTPPTATFGTAVPGANAAGWNNSSVSIPFSVVDNLSGVASSSLPSPLVVSTEGRGVSVSFTVTDVAGNVATFSSPPMNIDTTPPEVGCVPVTLRGQEDEQPTFRVTAADGLSGVKSLALGSFSLSQGEFIQIRPSRRSGIRLLGSARGDDDEVDGSRETIRRFRVGPGEAVILARDVAGNVGTATCLLPVARDEELAENNQSGQAGAGRKKP